MKNDGRPADEIQKANDKCHKLQEEYHAASKKETRKKHKKDKEAELKKDLEKEPRYPNFDDRYDASLAFPPWHKPSGGRPKSTSRMKSASEIRCGKKRKQMKCTLCHRYCQRRAKKKSNIPCRPGEQDTAIDASGSDEEKQDGNGG